MPAPSPLTVRQARTTTRLRLCTPHTHPWHTTPYLSRVYVAGPQRQVTPSLMETPRYPRPRALADTVPAVRHFPVGVFAAETPRYPRPLFPSAVESSPAASSSRFDLTRPGPAWPGLARPDTGRASHRPDIIHVRCAPPLFLFLEQLRAALLDRARPIPIRPIPFVLVVPDLAPPHPALS